MICSSSVAWSYVSADLLFEEVTTAAGIVHKGPTFGASWGDLNEDGYPDIWVGNHFEKPSLYLNQRDGTFKNVIEETWKGDEHVDAHGAAWADFDNDGDQDLIELAGAQSGVGQGPSHFYVNDGGRLVEQAERLGLQQPMGRGRLPIWLDADRDGRLDIVYMNSPRVDGQAQSSLFLQTDSVFVDASKRLGFKAPQRSRVDKLKDMLRAARHLRFGVPPVIYGHASFAQLADFTDDNSLDLLTFGPLRIYDLSGERFRDVTYDFEFERITGVRDAAVADFDNDGDMDMYLVRAQPRSAAFQVDTRTLRAAFLGKSHSGIPQILVFESGGSLHFSLAPWRMKPSNILIGGERRPAEDLAFTLEREDATTNKKSWNEPAGGKVSIEYSTEAGRWRIVAMNLDVFLEIEGTNPISIIEAPGQSDRPAGLDDVLLFKNGSRLLPTIPYTGPDAVTQCHSVVAEDFDNDGDSDIYLVCSGSAVNSQNVLLENDGLGRFSVVPDAGGAAGSAAGRGDVVTSGDYDGDGYIDLFLTNGVGERMFVAEGPHQLFRNQGKENNWLQLELRGTVSNRDGIGARVVLESAGKRQIREQGGGMHKYAQNFDRVHFGLGKAEAADKITVHWPSGAVQNLEGVTANQVMVVREQ